MTTTTANGASEGRGRVARLFAGALDDDEQALRELQLLALELTPGTTTEVLEAGEALRAIDGPRPDGSCPLNLESEGPTPSVIAYVDLLEARYRNEPSSSTGFIGPLRLRQTGCSQPDARQTAGRSPQRARHGRWRGR